MVDARKLQGHTITIDILDNSHDGKNNIRRANILNLITNYKSKKMDNEWLDSTNANSIEEETPRSLAGGDASGLRLRVATPEFVMRS